MLLTVETATGPKRIRVCDYCKSACIPSGHFCSGYCARAFDEQRRSQPLKESLQCVPRIVTE
jgi:hypothetical protein